jgi:hypothetical protein
MHMEQEFYDPNIAPNLPPRLADKERELCEWAIGRWVGDTLESAKSAGFVKEVDGKLEMSAEAEATLELYESLMVKVVQADTFFDFSEGEVDILGKALFYAGFLGVGRDQRELANSSSVDDNAYKKQAAELTSRAADISELYKGLKPLATSLGLHWRDWEPPATAARSLRPIGRRIGGAVL